MNRWWVIFLAGMLMLLACKPVVLTTSFLLQRSTIAEKWCINKNDTLKMCSGACFLEQQVADNTHTSFPISNETSAQFLDVSVYFLSTSALFLSHNLPIFSYIQLPFAYQGLKERSTSADIDHPPSYLL